MANLFFPQLSTGAIAQFPFSKTRSVRTVENLLADGSMVLSPDPNSHRIIWNLRFDQLSPAEMLTMQQFFTACGGPFRSFTFIDPADNMLTYSTDATNAAWSVSPGISVTPGLGDPFGGTTAFTATNAGQTVATIAQTLAVASNYQYCFSLYARSQPTSDVALTLTGSIAASTQAFACGTSWKRLVLSGRLNDSGTTLTAAIQLQPGQTVQLFGPQLEAQTNPSSYRPTASGGGVYANSHWASNQLTFSADGPNSFATLFSIESVL